MATLNLDNKLYDLSKISKEAIAKIESARFCDRKIAELEAELSVLRTARAAYLSVLPSLVSDDALVKEGEEPKAAPKRARKTPAKKTAAKKNEEETKH